MRERPTSGDRVRYRFGPLERRGLIAGWRGGQIASVAAGLVVGVFVLRWRPSVAGVILALGFAGAGVMVAVWPVGGRTAEQWCPLVVRWAMAGLTGSRLQLAGAPRTGQAVRVDADGVATPVPAAPGRPPGVRLAPTGVFEGLRLVGCPVADGATDAGVAIDARSRTATAVLAVRGHSFALLGPSDQDARVAGWARVLAALAREGSAVHRVQWVESCLPDDGGGARRYLRHHAELDGESAAARSYSDLVEQSAPVTRRHRTLLAVSVHTSHAGRAIRASGGGDAGVGAVLLREAMALQRLLEDTDATVEGILSPDALAAVYRQAMAPLSQLVSPGSPPFGRDSDVGGTGAAGPPWPMAVAPTWDAVHTDGTWHATYWIAEWPRVDITPDFLGPLLFSSVRRSISLVMEPVSPSRAARQVAQARTADIADGELRRRGGFLVTARQTREKEGVEHRDTELADGHAQYRFSGYVTVTADDRDALREGCAALEQAGGQARLELRRLYGEQDVAFACTLPLGRGLA